jgi:hypothetical protein
MCTSLLDIASNGHELLCNLRPCAQLYIINIADFPLFANEAIQSENLADRAILLSMRP